MIKDKALEDLFVSYHPHLNDKEEFMEQLTRKLDAVEYLHHYIKANLHRYRCAMVATFVIGIICGSVLLYIIHTFPSDVPLFTFKVQTGLLLFIEQNFRMIVLIILSLLCSFLIIGIFATLHDITRMRIPIKDVSQ